MKAFNQMPSGSMVLQLLALCTTICAMPNILGRDPQSNGVPSVGEISQGAATVLKVVHTPNTETNVTFSKFVTPSASLRQSDSLVCLVEGMQQIYSRGSQIKAHLPNQGWTFSGSDGRNAKCLTMSNVDSKDHLLTWGIIAEALSAVAIGLSNMTATSCQFDVYSKKWGHLGYGQLGMQYGEGPVDAAGTSVATS
ncbi:hypothetical protein XPA_000327 [Xanthoria parietina]